jgi:hypothetical protein
MSWWCQPTDLSKIPGAAGGILDPLETDWWDPTGGRRMSWEWDHPEALEECPVDSPKAARWQEHSFFSIAATKFTAIGQCLELARFFAPPGMVGQVSRLETSLLYLDLESNPLVADGGISPYAYEIAYGAAIFTSVLQFHLRLQSWLPGQSLPPGPQFLQDQTSLPGTAHPSLGSWPDARYDYARRDNHVSLFVPDGHVLRLFGQMRQLPRPDYPALLYGRLGGITQTYRDNRDAISASRQWPG